MHLQAGAAEEWRQFWFLPLLAALGYSSAVLHTYGVGPFIEPIQAEFGWSRAGMSFGLTIVGAVGALLAIPMGMVVDRLGPRRVALVGTILMPVSMGLLGTTSDSLAHWYMLWGLVAFANLWMQATVWTSALASRFEKSRGMAFAVCFSGASFTATVLPFIATSLIMAFDWRTAIMLIGAIWTVAVFPLMFFFFRGAQDVKAADGKVSQAPPVSLPGATVAEALRSFSFYSLFLASLLFTTTAVGMIVHIVPILKDQGATALGAAGIASLVGIFSIIGRLGTGFLLDRFPPNLVGALSFMLPVIACLLLLFDGANPVSQSVAASLFGFTLGAEVDVIAYLATRQFGLKNYGVIFGAIVTAMAAGGAIGPLVAGFAYDIYSGYSQFLMLTMALMVISAAAVIWLGKPGVWRND
ncbi:MFS transporter [Novosphingobium malaysiense]|uniref:MFS transporter n=1 Tax=Novosphingobium malaysiense TaxID=1348853 RepID=A0A0B1ZLX7_9SPHN|nr:MFS transporter [Novosphingobium malaysiense]KHK90290.1 MFS transporter [Novosphingobium malaysiense]